MIQRKNSIIFSLNFGIFGMRGMHCTKKKKHDWRYFALNFGTFRDFFEMSWNVTFHCQCCKIKDVVTFNKSELARSQKNFHRSVRMDPKNLKGSFCFWFKFIFKGFVILEGFLTNLVVKIYMLLYWYKAMYHWLIAPVVLEWYANLQEEEYWEIRLVRIQVLQVGHVAWNVVETVEWKAFIAVARTSSTSNVALWFVCGGWARKCIVNTVATVWCIYWLWVSACGQDWLYVQNLWKMLEGKTSELSPIGMDDLHWFWVPRETGVVETFSNVVARSLKVYCKLHKVSFGVNACKSKEFHITMWVWHWPWANKINWNFLPLSTSNPDQRVTCDQGCWIFLIDIHHKRIFYVVISGQQHSAYAVGARVYKYCMEPM